jgi:hypothetical protein
VMSRASLLELLLSRFELSLELCNTVSRGWCLKGISRQGSMTT